MQKSIFLLEEALKFEKQSAIARSLDVAPQTLCTAKDRGKVSPALAWGLAEKLGLNPQWWSLVAAAEGEKESAAKRRMLASLAKMERAMGIEPTS